MSRDRGRWYGNAWINAVACCVFSVSGAGSVVLANELDATSAAAEVDRLLAQELFAADGEGSVEPAAQVDDETFLRRVTLDLVGELPTPDEVTAFALDPSPDKRSAAVERLLADPRFGENWARYWRDVMLYRRSDDRALLTSGSVVALLAGEFNGDPHWDDIAREFITAEGNLAEDGTTALIASQWGQIPETAAEVSRVFLGIQIQCAQCHDHPTDRWQRAEFHELAAFFPRIGVRAIREEGKRRGFELFTVDRGREPQAAKPGKPPRPVNAKARKRLEHFMPDLEDPAAEGTLMQPVFFLTGEKLDEGQPDRVRRETLADWMVSAENPWFAKAYVNRIWAEMVGEGFYEPIDDLGPDRECSAPETIEFLATQFTEHDFDVKWLYRAIASTDAYGRASQPRRQADAAPFAANCPQRLRADQLFDAVVDALGLDDRIARQGDEDPRKALRGGVRTPRGQFMQAFGYDPSDPRDEVQGSISQALLLMNSPIIAAALDAERPGTELGQLLDRVENDEDVVVELYLRCLSREPSDAEIKTCLDYVGELKNREEAFEDILWALVNSTEFLHR